jgi:hypothetical protein
MNTPRAGRGIQTKGEDMRYRPILLCTLFCLATPAFAQLSIGVGLPEVNIGVQVPVYPQLVPVPGYPVYYAPQLGANYFFYDGFYWVYQGDQWYSSSWYNGPWASVPPEAVPLFVLRVPVRYYRRPPPFFVGWGRDSAPRWGEHWGGGWEQGHRGWDHWDRGSAPRPAPLPTYQRQYSGGHYPQAQQQQALESKNYHYQPRDAAVQERSQQRTQGAPGGFEQGRTGASPPGNSRQEFGQRPQPGAQPQPSSQGKPPQGRQAEQPRAMTPQPQSQGKPPQAQKAEQPRAMTPQPSAHPQPAQPQPPHPQGAQHQEEHGQGKEHEKN